MKKRYFGTLSRHSCFCAFCRTERQVYRKRRSSLINVVAAAVSALALMLLIWHQFDPQVLPLFVAFLAVAETFVQIRWRLNIVCSECGFDPVLYVRDVEKAVAKVQEHLRKRQEDPAGLLRTPLHLPVRRMVPKAPPPPSPRLSRSV